MVVAEPQVDGRQHNNYPRQTRTRGGGTARGKDKGEDGGADGDNDGKAIGGNDNVHHQNQQSTNDGGKRMQRTVWGGAGERQVAKPPEAEVSAVKRPAWQQEP